MLSFCWILLFIRLGVKTEEHLKLRRNRRIYHQFRCREHRCHVSLRWICWANCPSRKSFVVNGEYGNYDRPSVREKVSTLGAAAVRHLKTHLFEGNHALAGDGTEFVLVSSPGVKQPNAAKTGVILNIHVRWCSIPVIADSITRSNRAFLSRVPYRRKSLFTCTLLTLLRPSESYVDLFNGRKRHPVTIRPAFSRLATMFRSALCSTLAVGCQVSIGLVAPVASFIFKLPFPAVVGSLVFRTATLVIVFNYTFKEVS